MIVLDKSRGSQLIKAFPAAATLEVEPIAISGTPRSVYEVDESK